MLRSSRTAYSKVASSIRASDRATPILSAKARIASGVTPRRRSPAMRGHPRIVPSRHVPIVDQPEQLPLAQHGVVQLEPGELGLLRRPLESGLPHQPVVELAVVLELEGAERVGDALERVGQPVGEVVQRIDAPVGAAAVMGRVPDAEQQRVPHQHVGVRHVDPGTQHVGAVGELPRPHPPKQVEVLLDRAIAIRTGRARRRHRAAALPDPLLALGIHVRLAGLDQPLGDLVQPLEVVAGEALLVPLESEPPDVVPDGVDVPDVLGGRVGVVEPQVAAAARTRRRCRS